MKYCAPISVNTLDVKLGFYNECSLKKKKNLLEKLKN